MASGPQHQQIVVNSKQQFDAAIQHHIAMGFGPRQMNAELAILVRPGQQKNLGCAFIFWVLVFFPVAIIMMMNNNKQAQEQSVTIRLDPLSGSVLPAPGSAVPAMPRELQMSQDREYWWDGGSWVLVSHSTPPMAQKSADGSLWWDGEEWRAVR